MSLIDFFAMKVVPKMYRGKGALHPCETGKLTENVSCIRQYDVNVFFITKGQTTIAIDQQGGRHPLREFQQRLCHQAELCLRELLRRGKKARAG